MEPRHNCHVREQLHKLWIFLWHLPRKLGYWVGYQTQIHPQTHLKCHFMRPTARVSGMRMPWHDQILHKYWLVSGYIISKSVRVEHNSVKWHLNMCCAPVNNMDLNFLNLFKSHATFPGAKCHYVGPLMTNNSPQEAIKPLDDLCGRITLNSVPSFPSKPQRTRRFGGIWEDGLRSAGRDTKSAAPELAAWCLLFFFDIEHGLDQ